MQCAIIRVGLHASLNTVKGKGGDGRQDAGGGGSDLGTVALYPAAWLFLINTVLLRHGASLYEGSSNILETRLSGHGSRSAGLYCG